MIETNYDFTPLPSKMASCKLFAFAKLQNLTPQQTLACFGSYYRDDMLKHPEATDHRNFRIFMEYGWSGVA